MAGGGPSGGGSSNQTSSSSGWANSRIEIPAELKPLYTQTANYMQNLQSMIPLWGKTEQTIKPGATPTGFTWMPGTSPTPATPGTQSPGNLWVDESGTVHSYNPADVKDLGGGKSIYQNPVTGAYDYGQSSLTPYVPSGGNIPGSPGSPGTPGYYDYSKPTYRPEDYVTTETSPDFTKAHPLQTAGVDPLQQWVAENVKSLGNTPEAEKTATLYGLLAPQVAREKATGADIMNDPAVLAAQQAFERLMTPQIENQMGLSGLGKSSSLANSLSLANSQYQLPLIQSAIQREQERINNQAALYASLMPQFSAMGSADTARLAQTLNAAAATGATQRGIAQEPLTAAYQDFLRRQALSEEALFAPFGAMAGPSIGPFAQSAQESKSQGTSNQSYGSGGFK